LRLQQRILSSRADRPERRRGGHGWTVRFVDPALDLPDPVRLRGHHPKYGEFARLTDSPVVELSRAFAAADGPEAGLEIA
jgi:hypothetical protein